MDDTYQCKKMGELENQCRPPIRAMHCHMTNNGEGTAIIQMSSNHQNTSSKGEPHIIFFPAHRSAMMVSL